MQDPEEYVISRRRKKYKFAYFANLGNCFELEQWQARDKPATPVTVEVGAGTALFSLELARRHPEGQYVAVDVKADRLYTAARQADAEGLTNISFLRAHARQLTEAFAPGTVSDLWLTFSDPFPKKRHRKHRLTHPAFLDMYRRILAPSGTLLMKTDNRDLFDWSLEQLVDANWIIRQLSHDLHQTGLPADYLITTTFERRFIREGLPIYFVAASC